MLYECFNPGTVSYLTRLSLMKAQIWAAQSLYAGAWCTTNDSPDNLTVDGATTLTERAILAFERPEAEFNRHKQIPSTCCLVCLFVTCSLRALCCASGLSLMGTRSRP